MQRQCRCARFRWCCRCYRGVHQTVNRRTQHRSILSTVLSGVNRRGPTGPSVRCSGRNNAAICACKCGRAAQAPAFVACSSCNRHDWRIKPCPRHERSKEVRKDGTLGMAAACCVDLVTPVEAQLWRSSTRAAPCRWWSATAPAAATIYARLLRRATWQAYSGQPGTGRAEHAGRRQAARRQLPLQRRAEGRHGVRHVRAQHAAAGVVGGNPNMQFDARKFTWLGSSSSFADDAYLIFVRKDAPVKSIEDAQAGRPAAGARRHRAKAIPATTCRCCCARCSASTSS